MSLTKYKFDEEGNFKYFPGNTVIALLNENTSVTDLIDIIQNEYLNLSFIRKIAFLPKQSAHMTVFELLCHFNRKEEYWTPYLNLNTPIEDVQIYFSSLLKDYPLSTKLVMKPLGIRGTVIDMVPGNVETEHALRDIRNTLSETTKVKFPNHDTYQFHISFGYLLEKLSNKEEIELNHLITKLNKEVFKKIPKVEINRIDYTVFSNMSEFIPYKIKEEI